MKRKLFAALGVSAVALTAAACSPTTDIRGFVPDQRVISAIRPGVDNRTSVKAALGNPSVPGMFNENRWYYVSRTTESLAFFDPDVLKQEVVAINFDDRGYVTGVSKIGLDAAREIHPVGGKTPTRGRELGFFEQLFGNIGRFGGAGGAGGDEPGAPGGGGGTGGPP